MLKLARIPKLALFQMQSVASAFESSQSFRLGDIYSQQLFDKMAYNFAGRPRQPKTATTTGKEPKRGLSDEAIDKMEEEEKKRKAALEKELQARRAKETPVHIKTQVQKFDVQLTPQKIAQLIQGRTKMKERVFYTKEQQLEGQKEDQIIEEITQQTLGVNTLAQKAVEFLRKSAQAQTIVPVQYNLNNMPRKETPSLKKKVVTQYYNTENEVNKKFYSQLKPIEPDLNSKRTGLLAIKVGMTGVWDKWGVRHAVTVLQVDRCQVVSVRKNVKKGLSGLQIGIGTKSLKKLKKPEIGHYLKAGVPPKLRLVQFNVTPENELPVGFQLSVRHFTPGQYIDVLGKSRGKGFQGVMKRWGFSGGTASHGTSLSYRTHGSTGQRQDPGRVFKNKKMAGRMGGRETIQRSLRVYKIDVPRSLIYIKGSVQGPVGSIVRIRDAEYEAEKNEEFLNYPTFIPNPNIAYAQEIVMDAGEEDPNEQYYHENDAIEGDDESGAA